MSWVQSCDKGRHKFVARYDKGPIEYSRGPKIEGQGDLDNVLDKFRTKTYVRDICIYCGKTVERQLND